MHQGSNHPGITIIDVENLGQPALVVHTSGPKLLLLDAALTCEERIQIMGRFLPPAAA
jgi:hypothetical protein